MGDLNSLEGKYEQELINKAYSSGFNYLNSGKSFIEIEDQLRIDGIPEDLISVVSSDLQVEEVKSVKSSGNKNISYGLLLIAIAVMAFFASVFFFSNLLFLPIGFFVVGIIYLIIGLMNRSQAGK